MRFSKAVVRYRIPILIVTLALMIPAVLGMCGTRINYDMLDYLPDSMDTVIGQDQLLEDFGKGAFSFIVVENMPDRDVATLCDLQGTAGKSAVYKSLQETIKVFGS